MTAAMELLHPAPCLLLFLLFLLTRPGVTSADNNGPVKVEVKEEDDVVLPCSHGQTDLRYKIFDWTKVEDDEDKTQNVFLYDRGIHYNNGLTDQDPQFKGRVSHFEDELQHGNASIKIRNTKLEDRGKYKCIFPNLQDQIFLIELVVGPVKVTEGDDVVLPCSLRQTDLNYQIFDWKKDDQKEVFLYDSGIHYNNGRHGQDPQFKDRVSHFEDELHRGNASIKIRNTKLEDRGKYSCFFPNLGNQIFHIELVVGASPKPVVAILNDTKDWSLLQCVVLGASPKPTVEWRDSSGNVVPAKEPQVTERGGSYDIILQTTVTKTDRYRCVSTQDEIKHQVHADIHVYISAPDSGSESPGRFIAIGGGIGGGIGGVIGGVIAFVALKISPVLRKRLLGGSARSNADSKVDDEDVPLPTNGSSDNRVVVKEGSDAVHVL